MNLTTNANLEAAFGGESMANRKYLFFADVAKKLGNNELAKLFRDTAAQEVVVSVKKVNCTCAAAT